MKNDKNKKHSLSLLALLLIIASGMQAQINGSQKLIEINFNDNYILTYIANESNAGVQDKIKKELMRIKEVSEDLTFEKCDQALKKALNDDSYACASKYYLINRKIQSPRLMSCSKVMARTRYKGSMGTPMRGNTSFRDVNEIKSFFSEPLLLFDSIQIDVSKVLMKDDTLKISTNKQVSHLPIINNKFTLKNAYFKDVTEVHNFKITSSKNIQVQIKGEIYFVSDSQKQSILNFAETINSSVSYSKSEKSDLISNFVFIELDGQKFDKDNLVSFLNSNGINL
jgi:hypothetical protein